MKNLKPMSYRPACMADIAQVTAAKPQWVSLAGKVCAHISYQCSSQDRSFTSNEAIEVFHFFTQKLSSTLPLPTPPTTSSVQPEIKTCMYPIMTDDHVWRKTVQGCEISSSPSFQMNKFTSERTFRGREGACEQRAPRRAWEIGGFLWAVGMMCPSPQGRGDPSQRTRGVGAGGRVPCHPSCVAIFWGLQCSHCHAGHVSRLDAQEQRRLFYTWDALGGFITAAKSWERRRERQNCININKNWWVGFIPLSVDVGNVCMNIQYGNI